MSLLPDGATFEEIIQDCFLAYRGSGLMLNALDVELLESWADAHVPVEVVARGIRVAAEKAAWDERPDQPALHSLRQCRRWVDLEIQKFKRTNAGAHEGAAPKASPEARWHKAMRKTLQALAQAHPPLAPRIQGLLGRYEAAMPITLERMAYLEELTWTWLLRALPWDTRRKILRETTARMGAPASPRARRLARRFHRMMFVKLTLGVSD